MCPLRCEHNAPEAIAIKGRSEVGRKWLAGPIRTIIFGTAPSSSWSPRPHHLDGRLARRREESTQTNKQRNVIPLMHFNVLLYISMARRRANNKKRLVSLFIIRWRLVLLYKHRQGCCWRRIHLDAAVRLSAEREHNCGPSPARSRAQRVAVLAADPVGSGEKNPLANVCTHLRPPPTDRNRKARSVAPNRQLARL